MDYYPYDISRHIRCNFLVFHKILDTRWISQGMLLHRWLSLDLFLFMGDLFSPQTVCLSFTFPRSLSHLVSLHWSSNEWKVPWYPTSSPLTGQEKKTMEYPSKDRDYGNEMQLMGLLKNSGISWLVNKRNTIKNMKTSSKEESLAIQQLQRWNRFHLAAVPA